MDWAKIAESMPVAGVTLPIAVAAVVTMVYTRQRVRDARLFQAVKLLGSNRLPARLAAISVLGELLRQPSKIQQVVHDSLVDFLRAVSSPQRGKPEVDALRALQLLAEHQLLCEQRNEKFEPIDLRESCWTGVDFAANGVFRFPQANLEGARFAKCNLQGVDFQQCDLSGANFQAALLCAAVLPEGLAGSDFSDAVCEGLHLADCNLESAIFAGADLSNCTLANANLKKADLSNCECNGHTCFNNADLDGASLFGMRGISLEYLESVARNVTIPVADEEGFPREVPDLIRPFID